MFDFGIAENGSRHSVGWYFKSPGKRLRHGRTRCPNAMARCRAVIIEARWDNACYHASHILRTFLPSYVTALTENVIGQ